MYSVDQETGETTNRSDFYIALRYEIVLAATMAVLTAVFACLCAKLSRQVRSCKRMQKKEQMTYG